MMAGEWTQRTLEALRGSGHRNGVARRAVVEHLGGQDCCLTAQEIFDGLRAEGRQVGIASIYGRRARRRPSRRLPQLSRGLVTGRLR